MPSPSATPWPPGRTPPPLQPLPVNLNSATVTDGAGNTANLSLTGITQSGPQIGVNAQVIQTDTNSLGSTSLATLGGNYFLFAAGTTSGPELQYGGAPVTAASGNWAPIGAVQTASGYDIAWQLGETNTYTVWTTDSNGNYIANAIGAVSGNSYALELFDTIFNQDLNGDGFIGLYAAPGTRMHIRQPLAGTSGAATIGAHAALEISGSDSATVTFAASTGMLKIDRPSSFTAQIFGFTGDGTLSGSDQIDLKGINFSTVQDSYANGVLTVTDGTHSATLSFQGTYTLSNFEFANDGNGGTIIYDPPVLPSSSQDATAFGSSATSATIGNDATLETPANAPESVKFTGSKGMLILDSPASASQPLNFKQAVSSFAFDSKTTLGYAANGNNTEGTLSLSDGVPTANIAPLGTYMASSFTITGDGHGAMMIMGDSTIPSQQLISAPHH